ncbi:hypothetical protein GCM10009864_44000 [Streptomyces lunalinharesii]|uniref:Uncharacterized protein n=1 Tax=Streptomyces lunalinharesii TaxID=333384 RepID=A0ABN3S6K6_9ACTN
MLRLLRLLRLRRFRGFAKRAPSWRNRTRPHGISEQENAKGCRSGQLSDQGIELPCPVGEFRAKCGHSCGWLMGQEVAVRRLMRSASQVRGQVTQVSSGRSV